MDTPTKQYIFRLYNKSAFNVMRLDESLFRCQCAKERKKAVRFQISHFYCSFSSYLVAVKGLIISKDTWAVKWLHLPVAFVLTRGTPARAHARTHARTHTHTHTEHIAFLRRQYCLWIIFSVSWKEKEIVFSLNFLILTIALISFHTAAERAHIQITGLQRKLRKVIPNENSDSTWR